MAATDDSPSFDDLDPVEATDDGNGWIDLNAGDEYAGRITGFSPEASYNGVLEIDGRPLRLNKTMRNQLLAALVEGRPVAVKCHEEEESFETEDGETKTYNPRELRAGGDA